MMDDKDEQEKALAALLHRDFTLHEDEDGEPEPCSVCDGRAARLYASGVRVAPSPTEHREGESDGEAICLKCGGLWPCRFAPSPTEFDPHAERAYCIHGVSETQECDDCGGFAFVAPSPETPYFAGGEPLTASPSGIHKDEAMREANRAKIAAHRVAPSPETPVWEQNDPSWRDLYYGLLAKIDAEGVAPSPETPGLREAIRDGLAYTGIVLAPYEKNDLAGKADRLAEYVRTALAPSPETPGHLTGAQEVAIFDAVAVHVGQMRAASVTQDVVAALAASGDAPRGLDVELLARAMNEVRWPGTVSGPEDLPEAAAVAAEYAALAASGDTPRGLDVERRLQEAIAIANELHEQMDWLGTGSDSAFADAEAAEYRARIDALAAESPEEPSNG